MTLFQRLSDGGEGGIRTRGRPVACATYRLYTPGVAVHADDAVAPGTLWHASGTAQHTCHLHKATSNVRTEALEILYMRGQIGGVQPAVLAAVERGREMESTCVNWSGYATAAALRRYHAGAAGPAALPIQRGTRTGWPNRSTRIDPLHREELK